jgi:hypothetical protein
MGMSGLRQRLILRLLSFYPPFLGAGIRVRRLPGDPAGYEAQMKLRFWNRNYFRTHFGGSLYTMCDPFFVLVLVEALGPGWIVWDKAATIRFRRPGRGTVSARFVIPPQKVEEIRAEAATADRLEPVFVAQVCDAAGEVVAEVEKVLHVRRKS